MKDKIIIAEFIPYPLALILFIYFLPYGSIVSTRSWSLLETSVSMSRLRFRFGDLLVKIWRAYACPRLNLPLAVERKRFAAPLCVFNFGILYCSFCREFLQKLRLYFYLKTYSFFAAGCLTGT